MGDRLDVSVPVLLDAAGRTDLAIEMASADLAVVARDMSTGRACWPGAAGEAFSALLSAWDAADSALSTDVKDLARKLQASAHKYAEAEAEAQAAFAVPAELRPLSSKTVLREYQRNTD